MTETVVLFTILHIDENSRPEQPDVLHMPWNRVYLILLSIFDQSVFHRCFNTLMKTFLEKLGYVN